MVEVELDSEKEDRLFDFDKVVERDRVNDFVNVLVRVGVTNKDLVDDAVMFGDTVMFGDRVTFSDVDDEIFDVLL